MVVPELEALPLSPVEEGTELKEVTEGRVKEVVRGNVFEEVRTEVLIQGNSV